jgi:hypothetical protein
MGRIDAFITPPETIMGMYLVDSLLTGTWRRSVLPAHIFLPAISLAVIELLRSRNGSVRDIGCWRSPCALCTGN